MAFADWLDERSGHRALLAQLLDEPVPGGARFAYVWGSCASVVLVLQVVTGIAMATIYSPSVSAAWASVAYLQDQAPLGWFVRGLHSTGASALILLLGVHLLQTALWGAWRRPRELNWIFGVLLLALSLGFCLTGYLLPWDQKGYWATQVAASLASALPLVGRGLGRLLVGGDEWGNLTLTRFYALHALLLPLLTFILVAGHIALFRRHGVTPSWRLGDEALRARAVPFFPGQLLRDVIAAGLVVGLIAAFAVAQHGAPLDAPADPSSSYDARPEWYFLPLFQLLKLFPGRAELVAAIAAPLLFFGGLLALPFIDRAGSRAPRDRRAPLALVATLLGGAVALGLAARADDAASPGYQQQRAKADEAAKQARALARLGVPAAGGVAVWDNDPERRARRLFGERCAGCHRLGGEGERKAPDLDGWGTRAHLAAFLRDPNLPRFFGATKIHGMKPVAAPDDEIAALVEYVTALAGEPARDEPLRARGEALFAGRDCDMCHEVDGHPGGGTAGEGPNLGGRGAVWWLRDLISDAGAPHLYGLRNQMPRFADKLSADEIEGLAKRIAAERGH